MRNAGSLNSIRATSLTHLIHTMKTQVKSETVILAHGIVPIYPTQKAVAFKLVYGRKWKLGDSPERIKLGSLLYPINASIEQGDRLLRHAFPEANQSRHYDEHGHLFCSGTI